MTRGLIAGEASTSEAPLSLNPCARWNCGFGSAQGHQRAARMGWTGRDPAPAPAGVDYHSSTARSLAVEDGGIVGTPTVGLGSIARAREALIDPENRRRLVRV